MASKWSTLKGKLPELPAENPAYADKIRARRDVFRTREEDQQPATMKDIVITYNALRKEKDDIGARESEINIDLEALVGLINEMLEASGSDIWRGEGYSFSAKPEPYAQVTNKAALAEHFVPLRAIDDAIVLGDVAHARELLAEARDKITIMNVPWQTINAMIKAEAEEGALRFTTPEGADEDAKPEVTSSTLPEVRVYLKPGLTRRKS